MRVVKLVSLAGLFGILSCTDKGTGNSEKPGLFEEQDGDGDGYAFGEDCNDTNPDIHPDGQEVCDPADVDEDCNGLADNADGAAEGAVPSYLDADGDGFGDPQQVRNLCEVVSGYVTEGTDCDDDDARVNPDAVEVCDPLDVDEDCDGLADDADDSVDRSTEVEVYEDVDGDGYGDPGSTTHACDAHDAWVEEGTDCDDADPTANPGEVEVWYDGVDGDCSGGSDYDRDGDGFDDVAYGGEDCDDASADAHPGADEVWYDGIDQDCSGGSDYDQDGDGFDTDRYGGDDCDDTDADYHPGAWETGVKDYDCSGTAEPTPAASAGYERGAKLETCTYITLDGTGSRDPASSALAYAWELIDLPTSATETTDDIHDPDDAQPTFVAHTAGDYTFELVVTNTDDVASYPDTLTLAIAERTTNTAPVANAGADQTASETVDCTSSGYDAVCDDCAAVSFTLDASGSTDVDDEPITYTWAVTSGSAELSDTSGETVTLTIPPVEADPRVDTDTTIVVTVTATDCFGDTDTDTVTLTATCSGS